MSSPELLLAHADRATSSPPAPPVRSRTGTPRRGAPRPGRSGDPLLGAVTAVIRELGDARTTTSLDARQRRTIEAMLRDALPAHEPPTGAVSAVRVACTYLAAAVLEDAYFGLLTARDLLR
ncbi:hypothetical protein LQ327_31690 [Actinomycetospora endophytica]|uniref:Uncharacterized protein n=1 Tax=Actinomycetospora endophytica TaxID=2291215 RepID=A0ABS8PI39_9PSEU|nr:hypothetical protein [Actinomycetospora endophytica]MCD2197943.1 hypothetical protein [Actinomycetospora endophytica]